MVAELGDPEAERTVVAIAHHDAAHGGLAFDQTLQRKLVDWFPGVIERIDTAIPVWWGVAAGPALAALGAATRRRGLAAAGAALSAVSTAAFKDIARHPVVPGANDNLSGVAALVALAEAFRERPVARPARWCSPRAAPRRCSRAGSTASHAATSRRSTASAPG